MRKKSDNIPKAWDAAANNSILNRTDRNLINTRICCWQRLPFAACCLLFALCDHPITRSRSRCRSQIIVWLTSHTWECSSVGLSIIIWAARLGRAQNKFHLVRSHFLSPPLVCPHACIGGIYWKITDLICLTNCYPQTQSTHTHSHTHDASPCQRTDSRHIEISSKDRTTSCAYSDQERQREGEKRRKRTHWNILTAAWQALKFKRNVSSAFEVFRSLTAAADSCDLSISQSGQGEGDRARACDHSGLSRW